MRSHSSQEGCTIVRGYSVFASCTLARIVLLLPPAEELLFSNNITSPVVIDRSIPSLRCTSRLRESYSCRGRIEGCTKIEKKRVRQICSLHIYPSGMIWTWPGPSATSRQVSLGSPRQSRGLAGASSTPEGVPQSKVFFFCRYAKKVFRYIVLASV